MTYAQWMKYGMPMVPMGIVDLFKYGIPLLIIVWIYMAIWVFYGYWHWMSF